MGLYWIKTTRVGHVVRADSITEAKYILRKAMLDRDSDVPADESNDGKRLDRPGWPDDERFEQALPLEPQGPAMVLVDGTPDRPYEDEIGQGGWMTVSAKDKLRDNWYQVGRATGAAEARLANHGGIVHVIPPRVDETWSQEGNPSMRLVSVGGGKFGLQFGWPDGTQVLLSVEIEALQQGELRFSMTRIAAG
jgi:hypothetical protein